MAGSSSALMQVAASGMLAEQFHIEVLSENIANVNTPGFKRSRVDFQELLRAQSQTGGGVVDELGRLGGVVPAAIQRMFSQGSLQQSANPLDMAVDGEGFFTITLPDGGTAYTRDGSFQMDATGLVITPQGYALKSRITVPEDAELVHVNPDGAVMVQRVGHTETEQIGTITLTKFANPEGLESIGHNLYQSTDASGVPNEGQAEQNGFGQIVSQAREESNVDLSKEMTDMIVAQRTYALASRAVQTVDQMLALANELRP